MARSNYKSSKSGNSNRSAGKRGSRNQNWKDKSKDVKNPKEQDSFRSQTKKGIVDAINDIAWYAHNPQMLKDSASIPFNQMLGLPMYFGKFNNGSVSSMTDKLPALVVLRTVPSYGSSTDGLEVNPNSAINIAAQNLYSYVRHMNSGHANYDPADLMVYVVALDQAYSFHAELVRIYGLLRFYSGYNRYLGKYLVDALGFDYDNLVPNLAGLRYLINTFAAKLSTFAVPAIFPIVERHRWIYSNVYMDRPSTRAQLYAFVPEYRGVYNEPVNAGEVAYKAGVRARVNAMGYKKTLDDIASMINEVISPILNSEDIGIMSGDILKAYGADKCYFINALAEDYLLGPVYVEEVLKQIHNCVTVGIPSFPTQNGKLMLLYQEGESPVVRTWNTTNLYIPMVGTSTINVVGNGVLQGRYYLNNKLLDTNIDSPTPEDVMIMTRLMNIPRAITLEACTMATMNLRDTTISTPVVQQPAVYTSLAADAVTLFQVFSGELNASNDPSFTILYSANIVREAQAFDGPAFDAYQEAISDMCKFNWHPTIYEYGINTGQFLLDTVESENISLRVYSDLDNCVLVERDVINRMHDVALLSMLNVPSAVLTHGV